MPPRPPPSSASSAAPDSQSDVPAYQTGHDYPAADSDDALPPEDAEEGGWEAPPAAYVPQGPIPGARARTKVKGPGERPLRAAPEEDAAEEEESEGAAAENPDATRAGPPLTLEFVAGKGKGRRRRFIGVRMVVGRSPECELHVPDPSVSRRHVELVYGEKGLLLRDLGSGNGTRVNGELVGERLLQHLDEIAVGQTRIRLIDEVAAVRLAQEEAARREQEAEARRQEEARRKEEEARLAAEAAKAAADAPPPPRGLLAKLQPLLERVPPERRRLVVGAGGALLLLVLLLGVKAAFFSGPPPPDPRLVEAMRRMDAGELALREGRLDEAIAHFTAAEKLQPELEGEARAKVARAEREARAVLTDARGLLAQGRLEETRAALARVPEASEETQAQARALLAELTAAEGRDRVAAVEHALEAEDVEGARSALEQVPASLKAPLQEKLAALESALATQAAADARAEASQDAAAARAARARRAAFLVEAFASVSRRLHTGELERAAQECDRVVDAHRADAEIREKARRIQQLMPVLTVNLEDGQRKLRSGAVSAAARPLRKARDAYQQMGLPGPLGDQLDGLLAQTAVGAGEAALAKGDVVAAHSAFQEALRLHPSDAEAQEGLAKVRARAETLFWEGYMVRDRDPRTAISRFRAVVETAAPGSEVRAKAERYLSEMAP